MDERALVPIINPLVDEEWCTLVGMWLHARPESTRSVYAPVVEEFRQRVAGRRICQVTLGDLQQWADELTPTHKPRTVNRKLTTIRSLLSFCQRTGVLQYNPGAALRLSAVPNDLAERILSEQDIRKIIQREPDPRNKVLLRVLYSAGLRASEAAGLRWLDARPRSDGGQISVLGKGAKVRTVKLPVEIWRALVSLRPKNADDNAPIFCRRDDLPMGRTQVTNIVTAAARRVGLQHVSAHWMRHAHATHSLDHGAPLPLIQQTLGHSSLATTQRYLHVNPEDSSSRFLRA